MSSDTGKMAPILRQVTARRFLFHHDSVNINFRKHGCGVIRHCHVCPVARRNGGKGDDIEHFFVVFLVMIPNYLPILHCEVVLVMLVIGMASDCIKYFVLFPM